VTEQNGQQRAQGASTFGLQDIEQLRLLLEGHSVVDWRRLALRDLAHVDQLLSRQGLDISMPGDLARLNRIHEQAVDYVQTNFERRLADEISHPHDVRELFLLASRGGGLRSDACMILKVMHIIHHAAGRELLYQLPMPIRELFHQVEKRVFDAFDQMKARGIRVVELAGSRKADHAIITKLLCRRDSQAAQVHDRQRFRIVTEALADVLDVLVYLGTHLIAFNYVVPGESRNDLIDFEATLDGDHRLRQIRPLLQNIGATNQADEAHRINQFTATDYRDINFVIDMPLRLDDAHASVAADATAQNGRVVFVLVEFQVVDRETHIRNNQGASRHDLYKSRQRDRALIRLNPEEV
tara:strand:- start:50 stop:1111 length:1062 start_codon:yes stop_codon:yes gene_type:complete